VGDRVMPFSPISPPYAGRFIETHQSPEAVILSAAKDLWPGTTQIQSSRSEPALREAKG